MGGCASSNKIGSLPDGYDSAISSKAKNKKESDSSEMKILLLGMGGVGKSTIFKQVKLLYSDGFDEKERTIAHRFIVVQMIRILRNVTTQGAKSGYFKATDALQELIYKLEVIPEDIQIHNPDFIQQVRVCVIPIWGHPEVKAALQKLELRKKQTSSLAHDEEWGTYFLDAADRILTVSYVPSDDDMLKLRRETSSPQEVVFTYDAGQAVNVRIVDVGGQMQHREQWGKNYDGASAVIYMVSLADFDQIVPPDELNPSRNALMNSLMIFKNGILKEPRFHGLPVIVCLNKSDILKERISKSSFKSYQPECLKCDEHDYDYATNYIAHQYISIGRDPGVQCYITNATDTELIGNIFAAIFKSMLEINLKLSGLT